MASGIWTDTEDAVWTDTDDGVWTDWFSPPLRVKFESLDRKYKFAGRGRKYKFRDD